MACIGNPYTYVTDSGLVGSTDLWEGYHGSRRCSRDTYPESHVSPSILVVKENPGCRRAIFAFALASGARCRGWGSVGCGVDPWKIQLLGLRWWGHYLGCRFGTRRIFGLAEGLATIRFNSYRGSSLIRNRPTLGPYSRPTPRALWWS